MRVPQLLCLPSTILSLLLNHSPVVQAQANELQWPYNLPPHVKYYPEHEPIIKRNNELQEKRQSLSQVPIGLRKMSGDPNEKFMFEYWTFRDDHNIIPIASANSTQCPLEPALHLHETTTVKKFPRALLAAKAVFGKRDFTCPTGTYACTSIGAPNSCCADGSTCQQIDDSQTGNVGCCPANESCGGDVSQCPDSYTSCPNQGGGCCLPGYACYDVGCVQTSTTVVTVIPTPTSFSTPVTSLFSASTVTVTLTTIVTPTESAAASTTSTSSTSTTSSSIPPSTSVILSDTTTTTIVTSTSIPSTAPPNTLVCSSGFKSCPASLGGGCCATDRACGNPDCPAMSSTNSLSAPARPTSNTDATTTTTSFSSIPGATCPTGFYACSAYYGGGCCQTGRDCSVTNCPSTASTTVVSESDGATVVAPSGSGITALASTLTGQCPTGWQTCTVDGGGCCPNGYACGTSCTATATASNGATVGIGSTVGKIAPESNAARSAVPRCTIRLPWLDRLSITTWWLFGIPLGFLLGWVF